MPIFEYTCQECGHVFEALISGSKDRAECTACGSRKLNKLMSAPSTASGVGGGSLPGPGDTACCGATPGTANGCAGPGSCCGKA